jgi:hypothetical protein
MVFPFTGPFLDAIMGGGGVYSYIYARYRKINRFQKKSAEQKTNIWIYTPNYRARNGPVPLIKRLNLPGLNEHMAEVWRLNWTA